MSQRSASHGAEFCHALTSSIGLGAFALACLEVALNPRGVSGFFYHSRMLAIVHLVTLGWITNSIFGSLYIVGPIARDDERGKRTRVKDPVPQWALNSCLYAGADEKVAGEFDDVTELRSKRLVQFMRELMPALDGQDTPKQRAFHRCALHGDVVRRGKRHDEIACDDGHVCQGRLTQRMLEIVRVREPFVPRDRDCGTPRLKARFPQSSWQLASITLQRGWEGCPKR